jgi:hypothetical protein
MRDQPPYRVALHARPVNVMLILVDSIVDVAFERRWGTSLAALFVFGCASAVMRSRAARAGSPGSNPVSFIALSIIIGVVCLPGLRIGCQGAVSFRFNHAVASFESRSASQRRILPADQ